MVSNQETGRLGEAQAAFFLQKCGMTLLGSNLRFTAGEVDLLMRDTDGTIVLVEVKTTTQAGDFRPEHKLDRKKVRKLQLLSRFVSAQYPDQNIRVDGVTLYWESGILKLQHYRNITE